MKRSLQLRTIFIFFMLPATLFAADGPAVNFAAEQQLLPVHMISSYMFAANGNMADGNRVLFDESYSNAVDGYDAVKLTNPGENFGLRRSNYILAVEKRQLPQAGDTIFFNITHFATQVYKMMLIPQELQDADVNAELVDKYLNTRTTVNLLDTNRLNIAFTADPASKANDRLMIVFTAAFRALPVDFTNIDAVRNANNTIDIRWNAENEVNMDNYAVEASSNGKDFKALPTQKAASNSGGRIGYSITDAHPFATDNYYRVAGRSRTGSIQYSAIIKVDAPTITTSISVYPNPVVNKNIQLRIANGVKGTMILEVSDVFGKIVYHAATEITAANTVKAIQLNANTAPGMYYLKTIAKNGSTATTQLMIQ